MPVPVLLDATPLASPHGLRGIGAAVRGLIQGFERLPEDEHPALLVRSGQAPPNGFEASEIRWPSWGLYRLPDPWPAAIGERRVRSLTEDGYVFHATQPTLVPEGAPTVATLYDLIPARYPKAYLGGLGRAGDRWTYRRFLERVRAADLVVVPSVATAEDAVTIADVDPDRIRVVPLGVPESATPHGDVPDAPYVFFAGGLEPHKNATCALETAAWLRSDVRVVLVGLWSRRATERLRRRAIGLGADERTELLGFVDPGRLAALRAGALAALVPSWCEGFGFPVLEAMADGVPVIAADIPALREAGGDAAIYLPPGRPERWAASVAELAANEELRAEYAAAGRARAAEFGWDTAAAQLGEVYREASGG